MYILKNALKCIGRSKGRNILIGILVLVIAISACIGLSIRQAAESAKRETLSTMNVTAAISFDRQSLMGDMASSGGFDRSRFADLMGGSTSLSLEEYQKYAEAESVKDFYYSMSASVNGSEGFEPVSAEAGDDTTDSSSADSAPADSASADSASADSAPADSASADSAPAQQGGSGGKTDGMSYKMDRFGVLGDFAIVGYSSDAAMTSFINGSAFIAEGTVFEEGASAYECIISEELAAFNDLSVGDAVTISNPKDEEEAYELTVVGFFVDSSANESASFRMGMTASDPANRIYMSYAALDAMIAASEAVSETLVDENTGMETETALKGALTGTYVFADADAYYQFEEDVRALGLDESYVVSSSDLNSYENSMIPLNTLSTMAGWFLLVILLIGAVILIVLNIFNVRERKYEIGVLTAMGMKKGKVALQFLTEIFAVTLAAVMIGIGAGAVTSVPVTNALLANQVASQQAQAEEVTGNFGRSQGGLADGSVSGGGNPFANMFGGSSETNYVTEVSSAMNLAVVFQMFGIAILLTLISSAVSLLFVMRYDPLKILTDRD